MDRTDIESLSNSKEVWSCLRCNSENFPFNSSFDDEDGFVPQTDSALKPFFLAANSSVSENDENFHEELVNKIDCRYLDCNEFNKSFSNSQNLSFLHLNIASLSKHLDNFTTLLNSLYHQFKIIGISETRISSQSIEHNLNIPGYISHFTKTESSAGGTGIYISNDVNSKIRNDLSLSLYKSKCLESTFVEISPDNKSNIIVGCIYKHPSFSIDEFNLNYLAPFLDKLNKEGKKIVLMGDFNINLLNEGNNNSVNDFIDTLTNHLILPTISLPTRVTVNTQTLIDNIFISPFDHEIYSGNLTVGISDHLPQFLILKTAHHITNNSETFYRDWNSFNQDAFILDFFENDWNIILNLKENDPDTSFKNFYDKISTLINLHAPLKKLSRKQKLNKVKPWITKGIKKSINHRNKLLNLFIKSKIPQSKEQYYNEYKNYRNNIVNLIRISKSNHYKHFFNTNINNSKNIWKGINELINLQDKNNVSNITLNINNKTETDPSITSNIFNNYFTTVADKIRNTIPKTIIKFNQFLKNSPNNSFFFNPISEYEVLKTIKSLDPNKASGPNSIPNKILNLLLIDISDILTKIFNLSFQTGKFISLLKNVKVIPIFKNKGSAFDVSNFRPISLLSNIDKIFEKLVHSRVTSFLNANNLIFNKQFGFRSKHSTTHTLITITERIRTALDKGEFSCGVFIDLQKAFDTVDHQILLTKLKHYGVRGITNKWFESYLSNRRQSVFISGHYSEYKILKHGVPQGSVLGPLLFLLYINDLPNAILNSESFLFADDTGLLFSDKNPKVIESKINLDLRTLISWLNSNMISLNATKTEVILFRNPQKTVNHNICIKLNGKPLNFTSSVKYLGITLDEHLSWKNHYDSLSIKLNKSNGILSKLRHFLPRNSLITVYYALFQSHISYANQVWGQKIAPSSRIFKLQKAAVRILSFSDFNAHSKPLFESLNLLTIFDLIFLNNICLLHQTLSSLSPKEIQNTLGLSYLPQHHETRGFTNNILSKPTVRTSTYGIGSIRYQSILNWNTLQNFIYGTDLASINLSKLKKLTLDFLKSNHVN